MKLLGWPGLRFGGARVAFNVTDDVFAAMLHFIETHPDNCLEETGAVIGAFLDPEHDTELEIVECT